MNVLSNKANKLFLVLGGFFITNALIAEFIGVKIFALEPTLGIQAVKFSLFGKEGSLVFTAGVLLWPVVFTMTDIINEYFGERGVRFISWLTVGLIAFAFLSVFVAIRLSPADWWVVQNKEQGVPDLQAAFSAVFGQSNWIIIGSLLAFLLGQIIDVMVFHQIKKRTGERWLWLRAVGSTFISQFIDSFVVLYIAFVLGPAHWGMDLFFNIGTVNFIYKVLMAVAMIPVLYLVHEGIDWYLGESLADELKKSALNQ